MHRAYLACFSFLVFLFLLATGGTVLAANGPLVYGQVLDDQSGRPLADARVELWNSDQPSSAPGSITRTDAEGSYQISLPVADAILRITAPGYNEAFRSVAATKHKVRRIADARLSRRYESPPFDFRVGTRLELVPAEVELQVPPGAFADQVTFFATRLSDQALPASLPLGWSPIWSFELQATTGKLNTPLRLRLQSLLKSGYLVAVFDPAAQEWLHLEGIETEEPDSGLVFDLAKLGVVVLLKPDPPPHTPLVPENGAVVSGVKPAAIPRSLKADFKPLPEVLFLQESGTLMAHVELDDGGKLPSGTTIGIEVHESYRFNDDSVLLPEPQLHDHVVYRTGEKLSAEFRAYPVSGSVSIAQLSDGGITLHARHPDVLNGSMMLGPGGGRIKGSGGIRLDVPADALKQVQHARLWTVSDPPELPGQAYTALNGFVLDLADSRLQKPLRLSLSGSPKLKKAEQLLVFKTIHDMDRSYYQLVAVPSSARQEKALGLPGINSGGQYYLVRTRGPVGFARVGLKSADESAGYVLVRALNTNVAGTVEDMDGQVVIPLSPGEHKLVARQAGTGLKGTSDVLLKKGLQLVNVELPLARMPLTVVNVAPGEGEAQISTGSAVSIQFSEALDTKVFDPASVNLFVGKERVGGSVEVLAGGKTLLFRPAQLLGENTIHRLEISPGIRDRFGSALAGNQPDGAYVSRFTTQDNTPPEPPEAGKIIAGTPDKNGIAPISASQGTVEPGVLVTVRNLKSGVMASTTADEDGSFSVSIAAGLIDRLEMVLLDEGGNELVLDIGRVTPPPGTAVLDEGGGPIQDRKGTVAVIPKGLVGPDTIVRTEPISTRGMANPFSKDMPGFIAGAMKFDVSGFEVADLLELELTIDDHPNFTTRDRIPLFRINRELRLPEDLAPGSTLTVRLKARDQAHQRAEITAEIQIVADAAKPGSQIKVFDGAPSLRMELPEKAAPGQLVKISARGDPPNIKFRFPASPVLTGDEQFLLFEVREVNGKPFWNLADKGELKTLEDGSRVIQTASPPYRGIRKDTSQLVMAVFASSSLAFVQMVNSIAGGAASVTQRIATTPISGLKTLKDAYGYGKGQGEDVVNAVSGSLKGFEGLHALGTTLQAMTNWPDRNPHEFSVIPVRAGMPTTISAVSEGTNTRMYALDIPAIPPGSFSEVLVLGEDDNDLQVTGVTSPANHAVPVDATLAVSFSHLIEPGSINETSLKILDARGTAIAAKRDTNLNKSKTAYIATITPEHPLDTDTAYTLVATRAIKRVGQDKGLKEDFKFRFTTGGGLELAGRTELPWAKSFDVADDILLVSQREASKNVNKFVTLDASKPAKPRILKETTLNLDRYGPIWSVRMMPDVDFRGRKEQQVKGDLALVSAGNSGTFSSIQVYDVSKPEAPRFRANNMVSVPLDVVHDSAKLLVMPTLSSSMKSGDMKTDVTDPGVSAGSVRQFIGSMDLQWEVRDYYTANINGIPKTTAYPWKVVSDNHSTLYFINQGIGLMTIDLAKAMPQGSPKDRGERFGPSYIPRDKAGAIVVRDHESLRKTSPRFQITSPAHLDRVDGSIDVSGTIMEQGVAAVHVNGFKAIVSVIPGGQGLAFTLKDLPLREGVNELRATAFASNGAELDSIDQLVLSEYSSNPLAGPGSVTLGLPTMSVAKSESIKVSAGVKDAGRFDEIWINGQIVAHCGQTAKSMRRTRKDRAASSGGVCEGTGVIPLQPGVNTVVATAINLDEEFPKPYSAADLWLEEGLVLAVKNDLDIFDATGLVKINHVPIGTDEQPGKAVRVSVARQIMVDLDDDGKTGIEENEDGDDITLFDEQRNLALVGEVAGRRLTFVDITEPHKAKVLGRMPTDHAIFSAVTIADEGIAYVAADNALLTVDLTRAHHDGLLDLDGDGKDDRILNSLPIKGNGAQDIRLDEKQGLVYVLQRDQGVLIFRRSNACSRDYGVDVTQLPSKREVRFATQDIERTRLLQGLLEGLKAKECAGKFELNRNAALLSQGSSACIWADDAQCSTAYQPGLSDYDFEFIVPFKRIEEAKPCAIAMEDAIHAQPGLEYADVSVFPVRDIALDAAYRDVRPVTGDSCGGGDDIYGDLCLGRNGNILKWILEGEWVQSQTEVFNNGYDLDKVLQLLQSPVYPPIGGKVDSNSERVDAKTGKRVPILNQAAQPEPSHVPILEGREWACLQDFALNQSGALIRIKGVGLGDVPVQSPVYLKKLHKVAKAGMRTLYGLMLSTAAGNKHMLGSTRGEYQSGKGCMTRVEKPEEVDNMDKFDPAVFGYKRCESFTEYIASRALLSVKQKLVDKDGKPLLTDEQALLGYRMFRHKADVGPQISDEEKANDFIIDVLKLIDEVSGDPRVEESYEKTIKHFTDGNERKQRFDLCENTYLPQFKPDRGASKLKLKIPARLYNSSYVRTRDVNLAFYHNAKELARVSCDLQPGESHFLTKKGKLPKNCTDLDPALQKKLLPKENKALKKQPLFEIKPELTGIHSIQFLADPDANYSEYDKSNNYDGFYYYVLRKDHDVKPPATEQVKPPPPREQPDPPASAACLVEESAPPGAGEAVLAKSKQRAPPSPRLQLIALADQQYETAVAPGEVVDLSWVVRNTGNVEIRDLQIEDSRVGRIKVPDLTPGKHEILDQKLQIKKDRNQPVIGISTVRGSDKDKNSVGPVSSMVKINVVPPPRGNPLVKIYSPPKQDPPFETAAETMPVWGYVESSEALASVTVNDKSVSFVKEEQGIYRFETASPDKYVDVQKDKVTSIRVVAATTGKRKGEDKVEVKRREPGKPGEGESDTVLRVIKRVSTPSLKGWHERVRAKPGDQLDYRVLIINDGPSDLEQVTISDLDLIQPFKDGSGKQGDPLYALDLPPTAPFDLAAKAKVQKDLVYKLPDDAGGGRIANRMYAAGVDAAGRPVAASDQAEVLVDGPPIKGDKRGGLALDPGIVLLRKPSGDPKKPTKPEHITVQLSVARVTDGVDVSKSSNTRYQQLDEILNPFDVPGAVPEPVNPLLKTLWNEIKAYLGKQIQAKLDDKTGDNAGAAVALKVPAVAKLKFGPDGKMTAEGEGISIIRAVHTLPDGEKLYSNYSLVIVGIGYVESIDIQPRSFASFGPQAGQYLTNLLAQKITGDDTYKLLEVDFPMFLMPPVKDLTLWQKYVTENGSYMANWLGSTGFAELTSVKLDFMGGAISGLDILEAARKLLKLIPPVTVVVPTPAGPIPVKVPVGWFLAQLVGPAATQMVDFEASGAAASVRSSFPKGFVSAQRSGLARITGTLDFSESGFGKAKDDFLVFVGPQLLSTELRPVKAPDYPQLPTGSTEADILVAGQKKGSATLDLEVWEKDGPVGKGRKIETAKLKITVTDPPGNPADALPPIIVNPADSDKVVVPEGGPRRLRVKLLQQDAKQDYEVRVVSSDRRILAWARASEMTIKAGETGKVLTFARIGQEEQKVIKGKEKETPKPLGIALPSNADLVNYAAGGRMDAYLQSLLPGLSPELISKYREKGAQAVVPGCTFQGDLSLPLLADKPSEGLDNISLDAKISFTAGKGDDGAASCELVLKSYALGFPAPNLFNEHMFDAGITAHSMLLNDQGEKDNKVAEFVDNKGTVLRVADLFSSLPFGIKPSDGYTGATFEREIKGNAPGRAHAGVETGAFFLGDKKADTYLPNKGMGGLVVQVLKADESTRQPPRCENQVLATFLDKPLDIRLQGISRSRDEADGMASLDVEIDSKPALGDLSGLQRKDRGAFELTYTPKKTGLDKFLFKVTEGKLKSRQCSVRVLVVEFPKIKLPPVDFELPAPFCLPSYARTERNKPVDVVLLGFSLRSKVPGLSFSELTFDEYKPKGVALLEMLEYFGYDKEQPLPFKGGVKGFSKKSRLGITSVRYIPDQDAIGLDMFYYKVNDGKKDSYYCPVIVDVFDELTDKRPTAISKTHDCTAQNAAVKSVFGGTDPEARKLDIEVKTDVRSGSGRVIEMGPVLHSHKQSRRKFTYMPGKGFSGRDNIRFRVIDPDKNQDEGTVSFRINQPPVCTDIEDSIAIDAGEIRVLPVFMDEQDHCGDRLEPRVRSNPAKGIVTSVGKDSISYRPFKTVTAGKDSFTYVAYDGLNESETCEISLVIEPNKPPKAIGKTLVVQKNSSHTDPRNSITLAANDDPAQQLSFQFPGASDRGGRIHGAQRLGPHAMLVTYSPAQDHTGLDSFRFIADDSKDKSAPANISIRVNAPPVAKPDHVTTDEHVPVVVDVLANDMDPDGKTVRLDSFDAIAHADDSTVAAHVTRGGNKLKISPRAGYFGQLSFNYQILDSDDARAEQPGTVSVTVVHVNRPPRAKNDAATTNEDVPVNIDVLANDSDPDEGDELYIDQVTQARHGQVTNEGGRILYTPKPNWSGKDGFKYTIRDQDGESASASVTIKVKPVNDPPFVPDQEIFLWCCDVATLDVLKDASDPDSKINYQSLNVVQPAHKGAAETRRKEAHVKYKPDLAYRGTTEMRVTVKDMQGAVSSPARITLTIGAIAGMINEIVPAESKIELYNASGSTQNIKGWSIAGYTIGSQPGRESYSRPPENKDIDPATSLARNSHLVLSLPGTDLMFDRLELRDAGGRLREVMEPDQLCYENSGKDKRSLARRWDGFGANNVCAEFHWVNKPTLGGAN